MFDVKFTHSSSSSSNSKSFVYTLVPGSVITEKVPPQAQHIIELAYNLSLEKQIFTYADLIHYIDECCAYSGTIFTRSKGGTERIVRYYSGLLQEIGALTDWSEVETTQQFEDELD